MTNTNVVIGWVGSELDGNQERWGAWRPTVSLCEHAQFPIGRIELLFQPEFYDLMRTIEVDIREISPTTEVRTTEIEFKNPWNFPEVYKALYNFADSYIYDHERENYFLHLTTGTHVSKICMFLLAESRVFPVKLVQTSPLDKVKKGDSGRIELLDLGSADFDRIRSRLQYKEQTEQDLNFLKDGIHTKNGKFNQLIDDITKVSIYSDQPIILLGPTGAGKTKLARKIYELKLERKQLSKDFIEVNCSTIRGEGAMSALFGHIKGSYTGAHGERQGYLLSANQGMLFLDEIADLGLAEQAMLLRAIEEKRFLPYGSDKYKESDFQLIAGTNANLSMLVQKGNFREDLLARLECWSFSLPALRDRREDIEPNIDYELEKIAESRKIKIQFTREGRKSFLEFAISPKAVWKRNFRDLNRAIYRMSVQSIDGRITQDTVNKEIRTLTESWRSPMVEKKNLVLQVLKAEDCEQFDKYDLLQLESVLEVCCRSNSLAEASRFLFAKSISQKSSKNCSDRLSKFLKKFGLSLAQVKNINS